MTIKSVLALILVSLAGNTNSAHLKDKAHTIDSFFAQYSLIGMEGFDAFVHQREQLFAENGITVVHDVTRSEYLGREGHIQSVLDWFERYRTRDDFRYQIKGEVEENVYEVAVYGTLDQTQNGARLIITPSQHRWREYFSFNQAGEIERLQIDMNILSQTYDANARLQFSANDVASFVYQWFAGFDHQREPGFFLARIAEPVDMHYPEYPINSYQDFLNWYQGVTDNIVWNAHQLSDLEIEGDHNAGWRVVYQVYWQARDKANQYYTLTIEQQLRIIVEGGRLKVAKLEAKVVEPE